MPTTSHDTRLLYFSQVASIQLARCMGRRKREPAVVITLFDPEILTEIDKLIKKGRYASRSDFIKAAVYEKIEREKAREARQSTILYT